MSPREVPRFPRGFLLSERHVEPPPTFVPGPLLKNFWVHRWTNVQIAGNEDLFVLILGHCLPIGSDQSTDSAAELLGILREGENAFLRALDNYSGRHAIIFGSADNKKVVNDATGMRSVFYSAQGGVVASHALLVEDALGGPIQQNDLPFRYGYPGNRTPYKRTNILTPNTYYSLSENTVHRFWPVAAPASRTADEAAQYLLEMSSFALRSMVRGKRVGVTLTAGWDSRAILAVALHAGVPFETYTYGNDASTKVDRLVARDLVSPYGVSHTQVGQKVDNPILNERVQESHYALHHAGWIEALRQYFRDPRSVAVIGNLLEIGRSNYSPARSKGAAPPITAKTMAALHHRKVGNKVGRRIREYGRQRFQEESEAAFQAFIDETDFDETVGILDPFDQFYWEHRMATWQGVAMGERDFYADPFIPFNARSIFETMLGVPSVERHADSTVIKMIELVDPKLLDLPVNPSVWPPVEAATTFEEG